MMRYLIAAICIWAMALAWPAAIGAEPEEKPSQNRLSDVSEAERDIINMMEMLEMMDMIEHLDMLEEMDYLREDTTDADND